MEPYTQDLSYSYSRYDLDELPTDHKENKKEMSKQLLKVAIPTILA